MNTGRDIRLLTLYKQHYLDKYDSPLSSQFSCLGYYDGIDIQEVENKKYSQLFCKQTMSPISELWFYSGKVTEGLKGGYSCQNIGLFRCVSEDDKVANKATLKFWDSMNQTPYFLVGFVKLKNGRLYEKVAREIENEIALKKDSCCALTYCTYDNADLVVLLQGNSILQMTNHLQKIEYNENITYVHSVLGFSEEYLAECKRRGSVQEDYKGRSCFVDDDIAMLNMRFVTNGNKNCWEEIKAELTQQEKDLGMSFHIDNHENITWSYILGHGNVELNISDTKVRTLLAFLIPKGFLTHQNVLYGSCIYNIETYLQVKRQRWEDVVVKRGTEENVSFDVNQENAEENIVKCEVDNVCPAIEEDKFERKKSWCVELMRDYQKKMKMILQKGDEGLYSHFQALVQTLNMLDQYERFSISREMFCLLYPALKMFKEQLGITLQKRDDYYNLENVKNSLGEMVEYINSVIYHTVHTDQVYLMIPGYSGSSFSIPIKLNLLYICFIQKIILALNDSSNRYTSILIPVSESRPMTSFQPFDEENRNRLILVKISQRFLFMPRPLIIFLCHEIAHYVGDCIRDRRCRIDYMVKAMAYCVSEGISLEVNNIFQSNIAKKWVSEIKKKLQIRFADYVEKMRQGMHNEDEYYGEFIRPFLKQMMRSFLSSADEAIAIMGEIPGTDFDKADDKEFVNTMKELYSVKKRMEFNRRQMLDSGVIDNLVDMLLLLFQEVFCDVAAMSLLDFELEDFDEAFRISEGILPPKGIPEPAQWRIRYEIMEKLLLPDEKMTSQQEILQNDGEETVFYDMNTDSVVEYLLVNVYNIEGVKANLYAYAKKCKIAIGEYFKEQDNSNDKDARFFLKNRRNIKEGFDLFRTNHLSCNEIYKKINSYIYDYIEEIEKTIPTYGENEIE